MESLTPSFPSLFPTLRSLAAAAAATTISTAVYSSSTLCPSHEGLRVFITGGLRIDDSCSWKLERLG
ncbi:hypothetical protein E5676_scaffold500G00240 [Cucumis melo var. makuwa]|uniref:Uncharacterized protein n=1 Tax=Cucumis melo var. makuwa TaxID=1194695 RepID=A0A5D3DJF8_CUCMM|nr:hypothetical protein E5676_scaffold500G00240 [Cucumis melo var. makuwa]